MPTHEELARFLRRFNSLPKAVRLAFIAAALQFAEDLGDRGFDPTNVRPSLRLHKLRGENVRSSASQASTALSSTSDRSSCRACPRAWPDPGLRSIPIATQCELFLLTSGSGLAGRLLGLLVAARDLLLGLVERRGRRRTPWTWAVWLGRQVDSSTAP